MVDFSNFGFLQFDWLSPCTVLWTFRGRLRLHPKIKEKVDSSHLFIHMHWSFDRDTDHLILKEATEVVKYTQHKESVTPEIVVKCILYLLWFNKKGDDNMEYNWATHAFNYWVCDGIIEEVHFDESWEVSAALHQQIRLEDCSSHTVNFRDYQYTEHWKSVVYTFDSEERIDITVSPKLTSFFLAVKNGLPLPREMFQRSERLRVLKLTGCNFSFYSPPFHCCRSLRFLGLDSCKDQRQEEDDKQGRPALECFQSLWVLDVRNMDWELDLSQDTIEQRVLNIREVHIKNGRIWRKKFAWGQLQHLRKLQVIEPTSSWETGKKDEFMDMMKLELLDLSGNSTIQVLPSLFAATSLKTLILDGCVGLDHVGPEGLPPSLESFSFDAGAGEDGNSKARISRITLAGLAKLVDFILLGSLPNFEELDLSRTAVKTLDLTKVVQEENLQRIFLMGCEQLRSIVWQEKGMEQLRLLCIDTRQDVLFRETSHDDSLVCQEQEKFCHAHVCITDMRFLQSLVLTSGENFCWTTAPYKLNLYLSCTSKDDGKNCNRKTMGCLFDSSGQVVGSASVHNPLISETYCTYNDISMEEITTEMNDRSVPQLEPQDLHFEIGQGTADLNVVKKQGIRAISFVMDRVLSLHVHDSSSVTSVIPPRMAEEKKINWPILKWCHVERCPKLHTVFTANYDRWDCFDNLETLWAADLLMARTIWSRARPYHRDDYISFAKLRAIHLHLCPRLQFVLPVPFGQPFPSLESLHIVCCGALRQVFPVVKAYILDFIAAVHPNGMLQFPKLKHLYLHDLSSLQQICEAKIFAPQLETVRLRGCWGLRRLPATDRGRPNGGLVDVDCEKDWWEKLEWDGLDVGHHPSLFAPRHSAYYKKRLLRTTVLR